MQSSVWKLFYSVRSISMYYVFTHAVPFLFNTVFPSSSCPWPIRTDQHIIELLPVSHAFFDLPCSLNTLWYMNMVVIQNQCYFHIWTQTTIQANIYLIIVLVKHFVEISANACMNESHDTTVHETRTVNTVCSIV